MRMEFSLENTREKDSNNNYCHDQFRHLLCGSPTGHHHRHIPALSYPKYLSYVHVKGKPINHTIYTDQMKNIIGAKVVQVIWDMC